MARILRSQGIARGDGGRRRVLGERPDMLSPDPPAATAQRNTLGAWLLLAALFVAYIVSFVDRMIIGLLVDSIKADLQISDTQISLLQGLAFALFFTLAAIPLGRLIDRV